MAAIGQLRTMDVPGLGPVPVNPSTAEIAKLLQRGHSYIAQVDLSATGMSSNYGVEQPYGGYGAYLLHDQSPLNTVLEVRLDQAFGRPVIMRRGAVHRPGPVQRAGAPFHFSKFWAKVVQSGDTTGLAYFLILGAPEALYDEDPSAVQYRPTATTYATTTSLAVAFTALNVQGLRGGRLYINNEGVMALNDGRVEISHDNAFWEEVSAGVFATLAASTPASMALPQGVEYLRVRASAASTTSLKIALRGTMG